MTRHTQEGDIVFVYVDETSKLHSLTTYFAGSKHDILAYRPFKVVHTPSDTGDLWYLEGWLGHEGFNLALNPCASSFDGLAKHLDAADARSREEKEARKPKSDLY